MFNSIYVEGIFMQKEREKKKENYNVIPWHKSGLFCLI